MKEIFGFAIVIFITALSISSCTSVKYLSKDLQGVYRQKGNTSIQLVLNETSFLYIDTFEQTHLPPYDCCDTITYGSWELEKDRGFLILSTPDLLNTSYLPMTVQEKKGFSTDTIYFNINNPIESFYKKTERENKGIYYSVYITSNKSSLLRSYYKFGVQYSIKIGYYCLLDFH